jgi:2-phosphosulfolactate phosphatase
VYTQQGYRCRLEWGRRGTRQAAERGDMLVIVDTLSFATAVGTAIHFGAVVYPCASGEDAALMAARVGGEVAVRRDEVPEKGQYSLSPLSYLGVRPGTRIVLASPNGATCSHYGRTVPALFVGALVNARAVARAVVDAAAGAERCVTVIACGERWRTPSEDGELRFAVEDYLGAGAILSQLPLEKSPEARACEAAFAGCRSAIREIVWECASGRELRGVGFAGDVEHAAQLDLYDSAPVMRGEGLERYGTQIPRKVGE